MAGYVKRDTLVAKKKKENVISTAAVVKKKVFLFFLQWPSTLTCFYPWQLTQLT